MVFRGRLGFALGGWLRFGLGRWLSIALGRWLRQGLGRWLSIALDGWLSAATGRRSRSTFRGRLEAELNVVSHRLSILSHGAAGQGKLGTPAGLRRLLAAAVILVVISDGAYR